MILEILVMCIIQVVYTTRTQEASYICEKRDSDMVAKFRLVRNNDTIYQIVGYTAMEDDPDQSSPLTSCTDITTVEHKYIYQINITIDLNTDTSSPVCGIHTVTTGKQYKMRIRSQAAAGIKSATDAYYDFVCNTDNSLSSWLRLTTFAQGVLAKVNLQPFVPGLSFGIMDYATNTPLSGQVKLGQEVYYQIGLQPCYNLDTEFDTCGNEFWIAFHSFGDPEKSALTLHFINPSAISVSVQVQGRHSAFACSPVVVSQNSFGKCSINSSYEVIESSFNAIHVTSALQCIYVQRQHYSDEYFSITTVLPTDIIGQSHHIVSSVHATELVIIASNVTSTVITPVNDSTDSAELNNYQTYYYQFGSGSDISGSTVVSGLSSAVFQKTTFLNGGGATVGYTFEQVMSDKSAGKVFVIPETFDSWKCLVMKDSTTIKYASTTSNYNSGSLIITSLVSSYIEVDSTLPLICLAEITTVSSIRLLPYEQWSNSYSFVLTPDQVLHSLLIVIDSASKDSLELKIDSNSVPITGTWTNVNHVTGSSLNMVGLEMLIDLSVVIGDAYVTVRHTNVNFQAILKSTHTATNSTSVALVPGFSSILLNLDQTCSNSLGYIGDSADNDCDGIADEDLQAISGSSYADIKGTQQDKVCFDKLRVVDCDVSPDSKFESPSKQRIIENGCMNGATSDPFRPMSGFTHDTVNSDTSTLLYKTGKLPLVGFDGFDDVYLRCTIQFCFIYESSCESTCKRRRKRDTSGESSDSVKLITLSDLLQQQNEQDNCFDSSVFISVTTILSVVCASLLGVIVYSTVRIHQVSSKRRSFVHMSLASFNSKTN